jgi:hypothetical protein
VLSVGGLFSGIGGLELGLERAGMRVLWHCEQDPFCRAVLKRHWPDNPCFPDVREVRGAEVPRVDLLCGGFPCQDVSAAGRRAGILGERSGLWAEFARLVRELRPRYVLVENVPGLLVRGLGDVLGDLADDGYDAEWDGIPAAASAPRIYELASGFWPTPVASESKRTTPYSQGGHSLAFTLGGMPNPRWLEWLMGFPVGWTSVPWATPSSRRSPNSSAAGSSTTNETEGDRDAA